MKFDKQIFKEHYGKPYLNCIRFTLAADFLAFVVIALLLLMKIKIPIGIAMVLVGVLVLSIFALPLFLSYYVKVLKESQRQKQWFDNGILHVLLVPEDGFTWGGFTTHTQEYIVQNISSITMTPRYIEIFGEIHLVEKYNGLCENKSLSAFKVPRNFQHERTILENGGVSHADH